jgi:sugar-specific transcriptional regulator TrmB
MKKEITGYLEQLGLAESEVQLYLTLLETGPITVRALIKMHHLSRSSTYTYINQLMEKELVMRVVNGFRTYVAAVQPENVLPYLVEQKMQADKMIQDRLPHILATLNKEIPPGNKKTIEEAEIRYYKGKHGVRKIYEEALQAKELRSYANLSIMEGVFPENLRLFSDAFRNNKEIKMYEIVEDSPQARKQTALSSKNDRYFYKFLPKETMLSAADTLIYDGKVSIINVRGQITGVVLHNQDYYNNSKELFDLHWKDLPEAEQ